MERYKHLNKYLKEKFGERTLKICIDGGFTCPNRDGKVGTGGCIFCSEKGSGEHLISILSISSQVKNFLSSYRGERANKFIAYFQNFTNTYDTLDNLKAKYNAAFVDSRIIGLAVATRPDCIDKKTLKRLKKYKVKTIELGVQSANNYILERANRGHTFEDVKKASKMIRWNGFKLGHQMMVGLPESTRIDEINTAKALIKLKPKMVRIYPVLVVKNTKLEKEYLEGTYEPLPLVQAVETCKELVRMFADKKIEIIRIGLQNTEEISDPGNKESEVVAGPYHPAFRQLVESGMWYDAIVGKIKKLNVKVKEVQVTVNPIDANNVIGHKKENVIKLKETYDVDLILKQDENIKQGKSKIDITKVYNDFLEDEKEKIVK